MTRTISVVNQKGGVGKTTTALNLGAALARRSRKVLLIDLDPQSSLTTALGAKGATPTIYDVIKGAKPESAMLVHGKYVLLPSEIALSAAELELTSVAGREFVLKEALEAAMSDFDYVIFDCPPSLSLLTLNALVACGEVFVALQTEYLALEGMAQLLSTIDLVKKRLNPSLILTGIIATQYDSRKGLHREVVETIKETFADKLFKTAIRNNVALAEASSFGLDIFEYRAKCNGALDYAALAKEVIRQEKEMAYS